MPVTDCFVSVVVPVGNDAAIIEPFVHEVMAVLRGHYSNYELVLVDDGGEDATVAKISALSDQYECLRLIRLSRRFGADVAIFAGLDSVIGDFVVVMLPNSDPPQLIPQIVQLARESGGIVFGIARGGERPSLLMRAGVGLFHWYCTRIARLNLPKDTTHFRVLSRQAVNAVTQVKNRYRYLRILTTDIGYDTRSFVYQPLNRIGEPQTRRLLDAVGAAVDIMITTSRHPLRFVSWLGVTASVLNVMYIGYVVVVYMLKDQVAEGWTTLSLQNAAMFFFVFLILTVTSEYLGQILAETIERPLYYVLEERQSAVLIADEQRKNVVSESTTVPHEVGK